jgi:ADP-heptose:LPS heptosyltransferase
VGLVGATPVTYEPTLTPTEADRVEARTVVGETDRPRVALHPGATDSRRRWPADRFAAVGDATAAAEAEVLVTGTPPNVPWSRKWCPQWTSPARSLIGTLSIGGLAALYESCAVVVSNDTGPLHLAAAVGAATVGLFWAGNLINGGPVYREQQRPLLSWTIHCPGAAPTAPATSTRLVAAAGVATTGTRSSPTSRSPR